MAIESPFEQTTLGDLYELRNDIEELKALLEDEDALRPSAQNALVLLDDVLARVSSQANKGKVVRVTPAELGVISTSLQVAKALGTAATGQHTSIH